MSYTKPHIPDITSKNISNIDKVEEADNYIDWITYDIRQIPEYKDCTFSLEDNNNVAITPQENIFTNENQNDIDILKESSQCDYDSNIVDEYYIQEQNNDILQPSNDNINAEDTSDLYNELILEENLEKQEKIRKKRKELNRKELLLQNEEQGLLELLEPQDNMRNKGTSEKPEDADEEEPPDNMRNKKRDGLISTQYNYMNQPLYCNKKHPDRKYINKKVYLAKEEKNITII